MKFKLFLAALFGALLLSSQSQAQTITLTNLMPCDFNVRIFTCPDPGTCCLGGCTPDVSTTVLASSGPNVIAITDKVCRICVQPVGTTQVCCVGPCTGVTDCGFTTGCAGDWGFHELPNGDYEINADSQ